MGDNYKLVEAGKGNNNTALEDNNKLDYGFFGEDEVADLPHPSSFPGDGDDDDSSNDHVSLASSERTEYWDSQQSLLQEMLEHHNSTSSKLRQEIARVIDLARNTNICICPSYPNTDGCAKCLRRQVVVLLGTKGFNTNLFTSKWKHTPKIPGGSHEYIEVIASTQGRKKQIRILVELEFRDQFKMMKACEEYQKLIDMLPEVFIGKAEHLNAMVRIACDAAKKSMAEKKIHMGPWRKRSFMQMKWSTSSLDNRPVEHFSSQTSIISSMPQLHLPNLDRCLQFSPATAVRVI